MSIDLKDWLNSINLSKENFMDEDPDVEKEYPPFIINKCLSRRFAWIRSPCVKFLINVIKLLIR